MLSDRLTFGRVTCGLGALRCGARDTGALRCSGALVTGALRCGARDTGALRCGALWRGAERVTVERDGVGALRDTDGRETLRVALMLRSGADRVGVAREGDERCIFWLRVTGAR